MMLPTTSPKYVKRGPYFFNDSDQGVIESEEKMNPRHLATMKMQQLEGKEAVRETTETMHARETWSWL